MPNVSVKFNKFSDFQNHITLWKYMSHTLTILLSILIVYFQDSPLQFHLSGTIFLSKVSRHLVSYLSHFLSDVHKNWHGDSSNLMTHLYANKSDD